MGEHVKESLSAYIDGELSGLRHLQIEKHLARCETCRAEMESLNALSQMLKSTPVPAAPTQTERFASQVMLRLPQRQSPAISVSRPAFYTILWLIPLGVLGVWTFLQAIWLVSGFLEIGLIAGVFQELGEWVAPSSGPVSWALAENLLNNSLELFGRTTLDISGWEAAWVYHTVMQVVIESGLVILYWAGLSAWLGANWQNKNLFEK